MSLSCPYRVLLRTGYLWYVLVRYPYKSRHTVISRRSLSAPKMSDVCDSFPKRLFTFSRAGDTDGISALLLAEERHASYSMPHAVDAVPCSGNGVTALHAAALNGHAAACDLLLSHRADPDLRDKWGDTAADRAYAAGHYVLGKTLRDRETRPGKVPWSWARHKFYPQEARRRVMALLETGDLPLHIRHRIASFLPLPMRCTRVCGRASRS